MRLHYRSDWIDIESTGLLGNCTWWWGGRLVCGWRLWSKFVCPFEWGKPDSWFDLKRMYRWARGLWNHGGKVYRGSKLKRIWTLGFQRKVWFLPAILQCSPIRFEATFRQVATKRNRYWVLPKKIPWIVSLGANQQPWSSLQSKGTPKQSSRWRVSMRSNAKHRAEKSNHEKNHRDKDLPTLGCCLCQTPWAGQWRQRAIPTL